MNIHSRKKSGISKKNILSADLTLRAAALVFCALVCFIGAKAAADFYKDCGREIPENSALQEIGELSKPLVGGGNNDVFSKEENEDTLPEDEKEDEPSDSGENLSPTNDRQQEPLSDNSEIETDSTAVSDTDLAENYDGKNNSDGGTDSSTVNETDHDIHSDTADEGIKTDKEYFKASIKDGETVHRRDYSFTVEHLDKTLKLRSQKVSVNGTEVSQFSGKCRLDEGKNIIRISCAYTDKSGRVVRAFRDYTVHCDTGDISIVCDLSDGSDLTEAQVEFTAYAELGGEKIPLDVFCNDKALSGEDTFTVYLTEGENNIRLYAEKDSKKAEKNITVRYVPQKEFGLVTDLFSQTVYSPEFTFSASSGKGKMSCALNGTPLRGENGKFSCTLERGENIIAVQGRYGSQSFAEEYVITYRPAITEDDLPVISAINITDGMTLKGSVYSLALTACDKNGGRIYSDRIKVWCNGVKVPKDWEDNRESGYRLNLSPGQNSVTISVEDGYGASRDYYYILNRQTVSDGEEIGRISVSVSADLLGLTNLCSEDDFPIYDGESGFDIMKRMLEENGFNVSVSGSGTSAYIKRISKTNAFAAAELTESAKKYLSSKGINVSGNLSPDSLGEYDLTSGSGWIYFKNGRKPSYSLANAVITDGDSLELKFTLDYGNDLSREG